MSQQHITFEGVIDAYIRTGLVPVNHRWLVVDEAGTSGGCGLAACVVAGGMPGEEQVQHVAKCRYGDNVNYFTSGFDGLILSPYVVGRASFEKLRSYEIGACLRRLLFERGLSPQEVKDRYCRQPTEELAAR